ncbi:hypothetical protein HQ533_02290 [Candidatus Woesearchaeota archaeon]|nr:hypothetical protein [Candidatus Woesearchaeota archaeon]
MREVFPKIKKLLMKLSEFITSIVNFILLIPIFIIGIGLTSLFLKLFGKHFLDLKSKTKNSYWVDKNLSTQKLEKYYRMF